MTTSGRRERRSLSSQGLKEPASSRVKACSGSAHPPLLSICTPPLGSICTRPWAPSAPALGLHLHPAPGLHLHPAPGLISNPAPGHSQLRPRRSLSIPALRLLPAPPLRHPLSLTRSPRGRSGQGINDDVGPQGTEERAAAGMRDPASRRVKVCCGFAQLPCAPSLSRPWFAVPARRSLCSGPALPLFRPGAPSVSAPASSIPDPIAPRRSGQGDHTFPGGLNKKFGEP